LKIEEINMELSKNKSSNLAKNIKYNTQPSLPKGWIRVRLGEIAEIISGVTFKPEQLCNEDIGKVRILRGGNIQNDDYFLLEDDYFVPKDIVSDQQLLRKFDIILVSSTGSKQAIGKAAIIKEEHNNLSVGAFLRIIRINDNLQKTFIGFYFFTITYRNYIREIVKGVNINNIKDSYLNEMLLPLPPLAEQQRIVAKIEELFTKLDAGVEALKKAKEQIKHYRLAVLKYAFEGKLTEEWRKNNPIQESARELLEKIKEAQMKKLGTCLPTGRKKYKELPPIDTSELPELPEGWAWVRLGEIAQIISGVSFKPEQLCKQNIESVRILRGGNIQNDDYFLFEDDYFVPKEIVSDEQLLRRFDIILVSSTGSKQAIGKAAIIKEEYNNLSVGAFLRIIRIDENIQKKYIGFYFYTISYRNYIREIVKGVNINNIKDSYLKEIFIPLPPLAEQHRIVEEIERRFSIADEVEKAIDNSLKQAERLRQSILKKAFEGKLVLQDPNDEPAEKLLERIKAEKK